jgi:ADP-ribosyl-[dinitrogen reductase] hydrolase
MTFCPGKRQPLSITGGWERDLNLDLLSIRDWGTQVFITLLELQEFASVLVSPAELSRLTAAYGIDWIDAPIADGSVPDEIFLGRWRTIVPRLRDILDRSGKIVFCCMGGLGRTGMMAACLMIETGSSPATALAAVRGARPGTVENKAQEDFVLNYERTLAIIP